MKTSQALIYWGWRTSTGKANVRCSGGSYQAEKLPMRLDLYNHSPTGFEWGYGGSGPAQLALAILADVLEDDDRAVQLHQQFKWRAIASIHRKERWYLSRSKVLEIVSEIEKDTSSLKA